MSMRSLVCIIATMLVLTLATTHTNLGHPLSLEPLVTDDIRSQMTPELADLTITPGISVSGLSSGAFAAVQLSMIFSRLISNAGVIAGGVFNAAQGNIPTALTIMEHPEFINMPLIYSQIASLEIVGSIDPTSALAFQNNYIFAGTKDSTLNPYNSILTAQMYETYKAKVTSVLDVAAEHAFLSITKHANPCDFKGSPFINNCNFDLLHSMLSSFFPQQAIQPPVAPILSNLHILDQYLFVPPQYHAFALTNGLQRKAYFYVPEACEGIFDQEALKVFLYDEQRAKDSEAGGPKQIEFEQLRNKLWYSSVIQKYMNSTNEHDFSTLLYDINHNKQPFSNSGQAQCKVHIAHHGCRQTLDHIGTEFITNTGYLDFAESNNIITIFPQASITLINVKGCFDWFGYSTPLYHTKFGVQPLTVMNLGLTINSFIQPAE